MSDQLARTVLANNLDYEKGNRGQFCDVYRPVYPTNEDIFSISDQLVETLVGNNRTYERLGCGL